jgi:hypothetical protein
LTLGFVIGIHFFVIQANRAPAARLSGPMMLVLGGYLVGGSTVWGVSMVRHFRHGARLTARSS